MTTSRKQDFVFDFGIPASQDLILDHLNEITYILISNDSFKLFYVMI